MLLKKYIWGVIFLASGATCFAQCDNAYVRLPSVYNEPHFYTSDITSIKSDSAGRYTITIDTTLDRIYDSGYLLHDRTYKLFPDTATKLKGHYLWRMRNLLKDTIYSIGNCYEIDINYFTEYNNFLYCNSLYFNFIFDFKRNKIFKETLAGNILGNDDTSVFILMEGDQKWEGKKYYSNAIFQLSACGIKIISPILNKHQYVDNIISFFNTNWKVTDTFLYFEEKDCHSFAHYKMTVFYNNKIIDTIYHTTDMSPCNYSYFYCSGDTLRWNNYPKEVNYFKGHLLDTINYNDYARQVALFTQGYDCCHIGDYIVLHSDLYGNDQSGLIRKDNSQFTLNAMPWHYNDNDYGRFAYQIVALFNFKNKKFIGYPQFSYVTH